VLEALVELAGKEKAKGELELEVKVVLEDQVVLEAKVVLEGLVLAQEARWHNHRSRCTLSRSLRCIVHPCRWLDIRHNWKHHPTYSSNMTRPQMPVQW